MVFTSKIRIAATALVVAAVAGAIKVHFDRSDAPERSPVAALGDIAWPQDDAVLDTVSRRDAPAALRQVPTVDSLVGGLERRLAEQPDDARGWALLAQSYAFMGNSVAADGALLRAVALGVDEATLRARVDGARRSPHARGEPRSPSAAK
jgi:cytochrome c-type biogenesis protein CcmH